MPRIFRPTFLGVFGITNLQLGLAFSAYGVVAMIAYLPSGPLADLFSARRLMATALLATAAGGLVLTAIPPAGTLRWLYAFWGLSTILLFWSALIRATRQWGGEAWEGTAFGLLDGGRGLVAALLATVSVSLFAALMPADLDGVTDAERLAAFRQVILLFVAITALVACLVWFTIPDRESGSRGPEQMFRTTDALHVLARPVVWLQALIVVCAYVAYKGLDDVSLYAREVLGMDEVDAAYTSNLSMWIRPPAAVAAGIVADRWRVTRLTTLCFLCVAVGSALIASGQLGGEWTVFYLVLVATSAAIFAMRGLYFAIMREGRIPLRYTGTVVGLVSAIGYLPDVFMGPLMGFLLDRSPGPPGHQQVFATIAGFSLAGMLASSLYAFCVTRTDPPV
ncbi:MFS transporter [Roseiconus nitratireducens]|uniref:MFS transporter n=1 Tax=Roseiconus nitratireducens TaxID=2605748 RepID=A0A5M6D0J4_9BACT|nr:MFS transporter [Roseiconus nitratireducens]